MSFNENKKPQDNTNKPTDNPDIEACVKDQVAQGLSEEEARSKCAELAKQPPTDPSKAPPKTDGVPKTDGAPSQPEPPVKEITPGQPAPEGLPSDSGHGGGFGQYDNFEMCLQDQLSQGLDNKDSVVNCAAQLLQTLESQGQATPVPQQVGKYDVGGVIFDIAAFPGGFEQCVHAMKKNGMEKGSAISKCEGIFNKTKIKKSKVEEKKILNEPIRVEEGTDANKDRLYVRAFLLDPSVNLNDWGVSEASIEDRIYSFVGKPLVLTEEFDHPQLTDMTFGHALQYQDIFRIGTIVDVVKIAKGKFDEKVYYAICEITDENAKKAFKEHTLPLYVSPALAQLNMEEDSNNIENWAGLHLAVVDSPAFGIKKAMITGQCSGEKDICVMNLRQAHIEKFGYGNCGFCTYGKLTSVLTAKKDEIKVGESNKPETVEIIPEKVQSTNSSQVPENIEQIVTMTEAEKVEAKVEPVVEVKEAEKAPEQDYGFADAELLKLKSENNVLREQYKLATEKNKNLEKEISELQYSIRRERIAGIVTADLIPDPDKRAKTIETFTEGRLSPEQVEQIYDTVKGSIKSAKTYDAKIPLVKAASKATNVDFESANMSKEVRRMFIRKDGGN